MIKLPVILCSGLLFLACFTGSGHAEFKSGFTVVGATEKNVVIKAEQGIEISVADASGKFKIGDKVKYDEKENKIIPEQVSCICSGG